MSENIPTPADTSQANTSSTTSPSSPDEKTGYGIRRIILMIVTFLWVTVYLGLLFEKYGSGVPDLAIHSVGLICLCLSLYLIWTAEPIKKHQHLIYSYPKMSLVTMILVGVFIGGASGALLWWSVYRQQPSMSIIDQTKKEQPFEAADKPVIQATPSPQQATLVPTPTPLPSPSVTPTQSPLPSSTPESALTAQPTPTLTPQPQESVQPKLSKKEKVSQLAEFIGSGRTILWLAVRKPPVLYKLSDDDTKWTERTKNWLRDNLGEYYLLRFDDITGTELYPHPIPSATGNPGLKQSIDKFYTKIVRLEKILKELEAKEN